LRKRAEAVSKKLPAERIEAFDEMVLLVSGVRIVDEAAWRTTLLAQIEKLTTSIELKTPGYHTLHLYQVDPAIAIDRIVIDTGGLQPSYLGPPESYLH